MNGDNSSMKDNNDISSIVETGKPNEITITDSYHQSIASETPQIHSYGIENSNFCVEVSSNSSSKNNQLLTSPPKFVEDISREADKANSGTVFVEKIHSPPRPVKTNSNAQFESITNEIELIKKKLHENNIVNSLKMVFIFFTHDE